MCASAAPVLARAASTCVETDWQRACATLTSNSAVSRSEMSASFCFSYSDLHGGLFLKTAEETCDEMRAGAVIVLASHHLVNRKERLERGHPTLIRVQS